MACIDEVYQKLTGVNIKEQQLLWDERGKGYYGEYLVFKQLYPHLSGCCKILMNIEIPTKNGKTTEIDLLLIHETGLYVFEVKHYKGDIYGKTSDQNWTQYFRTAPNSHFHNPILQNQYHIEALREKYPNLPIYSFIVFTSPECTLRIECNELDITVCQLHNLHIHLGILGSRKNVFDIDLVDKVFNELSVFSPMTATPVSVDRESVPLHQYLNTIIEDFSKEKENINNTLNATQKVERRKTRTTIAIATFVCFAILALCVFSSYLYRIYADEQIAAAEKTLSEFAQKFEHVEEYNNGNIRIASPLVTASDVVIKESGDIANTVNFSCVLNWTGENYGVRLVDETKYVIILKDGSIKEYDLYNSNYHCYPTHKIGKGAFTKFDLPECEFYELEIADIAYIKLVNTEIWKYLTNYGNSLFTGYEIELYQAG